VQVFYQKGAVKMDNSFILSHVDHTLLKPDADWQAIQALCRQAITYQTASVCIPPSYVSTVKHMFGGQLVIGTVVGFPLGYVPLSVKQAELSVALADGADEIDMVINLTHVKNKSLDKITDEIAALKKMCGEKLVKVIIETCYLTQAEKISLCQCVTHGGADYIKTSTGFGTSGANMADITLFKAHIGSQVKIKAAGGIRTREDMVAFLQAGCARLGTSSAIAILEGEHPLEY
jgi:deoxyribose-phosphate aldolase